MSLKEEVNVLQRIPLFAKVEASKLKLLAFTSERIAFEAGHVLFRQGDMGDAAYIILEGEAEVLVDGPSGPVLIAVLGRDAFVGDHQLQIIRRQPRAGGFEVRRGNAARQHDEKIHREIFRGFEDVADAVEAEDVRVFVRVNHDRARAVRHDGAREFRRGQQRAFHMKMPVNQARREIRALEVNGFFRAIIADADDAAVVHGDDCGMDFAAQDVDEPGVFEQQFRRLFASRDGEFLLDVPHNSPSSLT